MKRYNKLIKDADRRGLHPREICKLMDMDPDNWAEVWAAARIYVEDGGRNYTYTGFIDAISPADSPDGIEPEEFLKSEIF